MRKTIDSTARDISYMKANKFTSTSQCKLPRRFWMYIKYGMLKRIWGFKHEQ